MNKFIITIDGPAGVGKSTISRLLAKRIGAVNLDTGAMYRAVTLAAVERSIDPKDTEQVQTLFERCRFEFRPEADMMRVFIDGAEKTTGIREPKITEQVKYVACAPALREKLVRMQQEFAAQCPRIVTEGRDQGTVAFPNADVKFFMTANAEERALRRYRELTAAGKNVSYEQVLYDQRVRDASDENRSVGPLKPAADGIIVDTSAMIIEQVVSRMEQIVKEKIRGR